MNALTWLASKQADGTVRFLGTFEYDAAWRSRRASAVWEPKAEQRGKTRAEMLASLPVETGINCVCGKPGGGKSMYSMKVLLDELLYGHRPIVTNLAVNMTRLQEYVHELGFHVRVSERVRLLEHEEVTRFYLIRGLDLELPSPPPPAKDGTWEPVDWRPSQTDSSAAGGVCFIIDECHNYFHPGLWKGSEFIGSPCFQWASQHRKLKDVCYFVTQSPENLHVAVRRLCQNFHYIRNLMKETWKGFRRGEGFERCVYLQMPKDSATAEPVEVKHFKLDVKGLASCYFSAGGVGVAAIGVGDGGSKAKGLPLKAVWIFAGITCVGVVLLLLWVPSKIVNGAVKHSLGDGSVTPVQRSEEAKAEVGSVLVGKGGKPATAAEELPPVDRVCGMFDGSFSTTWTEGWVSFEQAADTPEHRDLLVKFAGWKPRPALASAQPGM